MDAAVSTRPHVVKVRYLRLTHSLRITAEHGWFVAATYLVSAGAAVNGQCEEHGMYINTPLDAAVWNNHLDVVNKMVDYEARAQVDGDPFPENAINSAREQGGKMSELEVQRAGAEGRADGGFTMTLPRSPMTCRTCICGVGRQEDVGLANLHLILHVKIR